MATRTRPKRQSDSHAAISSSANARQRIDWFHGEQNLDGVRDEAISLANKYELTQQNVKQLKLIIEKIKTDLDALTAHEHYAVVITNIDRNGSVTAEVAGLGSGRVQVAVSSDVPLEKLRVGASALVSREKNCLLKVTSPTARWSDVGVFQRRLNDHRILLSVRESLMAVDLAHDLVGADFNHGDQIGFDSDISGLAFAVLETTKSEHLFDEDVTDNFAELGGLDREIASIKRRIDFRVRHPDLAAKYALKNKCGILLQGAPGNGKTRIARCVAGYLRELFPDQPCRFMHVSGAADYSMWFGQSEQKLIERFQAARDAAEDGPVVMFFDEVDAIAKHRGSDRGSGAPDRILNTFLSQLDGVVPLHNIVVLFATNLPEALDRGLLRAGRIDVKIAIPPPNRRAAQQILHSYLSKLSSSALAPGAATSELTELTVPLLSSLFAPNGQYAEVAQVRLNDGRTISVAGRDLVSGAMLENLVANASEEAAVREAQGMSAGVTHDDLAIALEAELHSAVTVLTPANVKSYVNAIPQDSQPVSVNATLAATSIFTR